MAEKEAGSSNGSSISTKDKLSVDKDIARWQKQGLQYQHFVVLGLIVVVVVLGHGSHGEVGAGHAEAEGVSHVVDGLGEAVGVHV